MAGNSNSGRRTHEEELGYLKAKIKEKTLEELAGEKVFIHLNKIETNDRQGVKEIALPVYLKSKADKVEHKGEVTVKGFNFISNGSEHKTHDKTGESMGDTTRQED